jgi:hypothetical protein
MAQVTGLGILVVVVTAIVSPSGVAAQSVVGLLAFLAFVFLLIATHAIEREEIDALRATVRGWMRR